MRGMPEVYIQRLNLSIIMVAVPLFQKFQIQLFLNHFPFRIYKVPKIAPNVLRVSEICP